MSISLVEFIQKKLGYPVLQKVDPVDHEVKGESGQSLSEKLGQAAIPAVLAAFYKFTRSEKGGKNILSAEGQENWLNIILENKVGSALDKVIHYAGVTVREAEAAMKDIAAEAVQAIRESVNRQPTYEAVKKYMSDQRRAILVYLPAAMQMGSLLEDNLPGGRTDMKESLTPS